MPMAGTLTIKAGAKVTIPAAALGFEYHTHLYTVEAHVMAENGIIYNLTGENFLLCVDYETERYVEFTEEVLTALDDVLAPHGLRVKKVMQNGMILLESTEGTYSVDGRKIR